MSDELDRLKPLHEASFVEGQKAVAQEQAAKLFAKQTALKVEAGQVAAEAVDLAEEIAADGDPHKRQIAEILKHNVMRSYDAMQQVADAGDLAGRRAAIKEAAPFSGGLPPSGTPSPSGLPPSENKALPSSLDQPKRGRGRPKGSKSKPKPSE